ncbi:MAG: DUF1592 domain-containing protein [Gammaproteobacteria bacterium]
MAHDLMFRYALPFVALAASFAVQAAGAREPLVKADYVRQGDQSWGMLKDFCSECHNAEDWAGKVAFDTMTPEAVPEDAQTWEAAVRKLRGHLMPPPGKPQPSGEQIDRFVGWMESYLDASSSAQWAGHVPVQRLNRTEYANSVRGLLGVDIKVENLLPPENEVQGFDNVAAALSVSPAFLDQYIGAARVVARLAVGDAAPKPGNTFYPSPGGAQDTFQDGMPLGTRGGMAFKHVFATDGEYRFNILDLDVGLYPWAAETRHTVVVLVDGQEVFRKPVGGAEDLALVDRKGSVGRKEIIDRFSNIPAQVTAGSHDIVVTFIERSKAESDEYVGSSGLLFGAFDRLRVPRLLDGVQVLGPFGSTHLSASPSRKLIFVCEPQSAAEEQPCAQRIAGSLARRAFRRPVTQSDVDRLMPFYAEGRKDGASFNSGIRQLVTAALSSPDFLYRAIRPPQGGMQNAGDRAPVHALTDIELASRLSFFLWARGPDDELIDVAAAGDLSKPKVLEAQVRRLLADPRASTLVTGFALKWLNLDELNAVDPDPKLFPAFSTQLREDFSQEITLFLTSVLLKNRSVLELLSSDTTFLNERLALQYGIKSIHGPQFRQVKLADEARFGLLGKGAMLLRTSYGDRTSPVLRGAWVLDKLMGTPPVPPPPNVVTDLSAHAGEKPKTVRARLEQHRTDKSCNQCHGVIDPLGLALENFDVTGQWRDIDQVAQQPIDSTSVLPSGAPVKGVVDLRRELLRKPDQFVQTLTEKMLMYAVGREVEYHDMPQVRAIVRNAKKDDYRLTAIVLGIVNSDAFRLQSEPRDSKPVDTKVAAIPKTQDVPGH